MATAVVLGDLCPEWCGHPGACAEAAAAINEAEREAEMAVERYYEGGWDVLGQYDTEYDREQEANDPFLQWLRQGRED